MIQLLKKGITHVGKMDVKLGELVSKQNPKIHCIVGNSGSLPCMLPCFTLGQ